MEFVVDNSIFGSESLQKLDLERMLRELWSLLRPLHY